MTKNFAAARARPDLVSQPVGDECVVYDPRADTVHVLDPLAARVWFALLSAGKGDASASEGPEIGDAERREVLRGLDEAGLLEPGASDPADGSYGAALARIRRGDVEGAVAIVAARVAAAPGDVPALTMLGATLFLAGRVEASAATLEHAVALDPGAASAWSHLGNVRRRQQRESEAAACYERARAVDPAHFDATCNLAALRAGQGRAEEAIALWQEARERHPAAPHPSVSLARFHAERGDLAAAESVLRETIARARTGAELHNALGVVLAQANRADDARQAFRTAIDAGGRLVAARLNLAQLEAAAGDWSAAVELAREALALDPRHSAARVLAARGLWRLRRRAEAQALLREGLDRDESALACADALADLLERAGERGEAMLVVARVAPRLAGRDLTPWPRLAAARERAAELARSSANASGG